MLSRFHVQGFKSLLDVEIELAPLVVLMSPNAAGKSNILESLLLLSRLVMEQTLAAALEPPLRGYPAGRDWKCHPGPSGPSHRRKLQELVRMPA